MLNEIGWPQRGGGNNSAQESTPPPRSMGEAGFGNQKVGQEGCRCKMGFNAFFRRIQWTESAPPMFGCSSRQEFRPKNSAEIASEKKKLIRVTAAIDSQTTDSRLSTDQNPLWGFKPLSISSGFSAAMTSARGHYDITGFHSAGRCFHGG